LRTQAWRSLSFFACNKTALGEAGSIQGLWGRCIMWIFDTHYKGCVELWGWEKGSPEPAPPILSCSTCATMTLPHREIIETLEYLCTVGGCSFRTFRQPPRPQDLLAEKWLKGGCN
jgi:hypothetical protein